MSSLLVVGAADVEKALDNATSTDLANLMGCVFTRISSPASAATEISLPKRISIETPNHTVLFMPGRITSLGTAIKVVSVPSSAEDKRGLPASTMVLDEDTGAVRALVNASSLTAYRTAAGEHP
jgi:ornithine cyclodeaminase/alanine dehydrogenase-like protein (mu-crystallin family)